MPIKKILLTKKICTGARSAAIKKICTGHGTVFFLIKKRQYWGLLREAQPHKKNCTEARAARSEIKKICTQLEKLYWAERAEISGSLVSYR